MSLEEKLVVRRTESRRKASRERIEALDNWSTDKTGFANQVGR